MLLYLNCKIWLCFARWKKNLHMRSSEPEKIQKSQLSKIQGILLRLKLAESYGFGLVLRSLGKLVHLGKQKWLGLL